LEPPLILLLSVWLLHESVNFWEILGASIAFIGVILIIFLFPILQGVTNLGLMVGMGEIFTIAAAVALSAATILGKLMLSQIPIGIYSIFRTTWGTIIFFFAALILYGKHHFMDVFSPFLWEWMLVYGFVVVVLGQTFWITGLKATSISEASLVSSFTPIAGILAAYFILGEVPTLAQYIGGIVIVIGVVLSQIGIQKQHIHTIYLNRQIRSVQKQQEIESNMGFKGL
jgi:drug/metabolite transporter (DMT)-like permease